MSVTPQRANHVGELAALLDVGLGPVVPVDVSVVALVVFAVTFLSLVTRLGSEMTDRTTTETHGGVNDDGD